MAVNAKRNKQMRNKCTQEMEVKSRCPAQNSSSDLLDDFTDQDMRVTKKEKKKPEMQLYRPGMGLQHKNNVKMNSIVHSIETLTIESSKNSDKCLDNGDADPYRDISEGKDTKEMKIIPSKSSNNSPGSNSEKPSYKMRRPDLKVYTPRPRIAAMLQNTADDPNEKILSNGFIETSEEEKLKSPSPTDQNLHNHVIKSLTKKKKSLAIPKKPKSNLQAPNNSDHHHKSNMTNSRSTPEGFCFDLQPVSPEIKTTNVQHTKQQQHTVINSKSSELDPEEKQVKVNPRRSDICWGDTEYEYCEDTNISDSNVAPSREPPSTDTKSFESSKRLPQNKPKRENGKTLIFTPSKDSKLRQDDHTKKRHNSTSSDSRNKGKQFVRDERSPRKDNIPAPKDAKDDFKPNPEKLNRKLKREKFEQELPPRFQKQNRNLQSKTEPSTTCKSGAIFKIPNEVLMAHESPMMDKNSISSSSNAFHYPPAPQQFIHKQLFNPKNPNSPEIINIPAPTNPPFDHCDYLTRDDIDSNLPFKVPLRQSFDPYIPPPQPVAMRAPSMDFNIPAPRELMAYMPEPIDCPMTNPRFMPPARQPLPPSPIYGNDYILPPTSEKIRLKPIVEKNLKEIHMLERELLSQLAKGIGTQQLNATRQCRWKLQLRYEKILLADPKYCAEKNAEQQLWKSAYYQIIEALRKCLEEQPDDRETQDNLLTVVHEGTIFYENLLEKMQETFGFNLNQLLEKNNLHSQCFPEVLRLVLISCQKLLIYLGDLARYKEQANGTTNFGKARSWYLRAQQLAPKNGRPYHQLAVLALCTRRKLDAVYYFMRSLAASNPFLSAREYLLTLFEDAKKKYEQYVKKRKEAITAEEEVIKAEMGERCEIWIKPDGSKCQRTLEKVDNSTELKKLSSIELNKRFMTSFLHVHGKLYTKVGMDTFHSTLLQMLKEFYYLLEKEPFAIESVRLLQLSVINMYAVANASIKGDDTFEENHMSLLQVQALHVSQSMMALTMNRCCSMHKVHVKSPDYPRQPISYDFGQLLPTVKVWTDWMSCQRELWAPSFSSAISNVFEFDLDIWTSFADLLTMLHAIDTSTPAIIYEKLDGFEPIFFEEESMLSGFVPLLGTIQKQAYAHSPFDKERSKNWVRISRIQFFGDYLCGIPSPYLEFDVEHKKFRSVVSSQLGSDDSKSTNDLRDGMREDSIGEDSMDSDDLFALSSPDDSFSNEVKSLWSKKDALSRTKAQQDKFNARVEAVLQKNQSQRPIVLQIQPRYLVPDTNCFVDYLQNLQEILKSGIYVVVVPLVVINELDGLARGAKNSPGSTPEHLSKVTAFSRAAITFLEEQFAMRNPHLRAITSKGSILDTISFRVEEMNKGKRGSNDDLILACCLHYCKDFPEQFMPKTKGDPVQLKREVILLTDDRNLRVKALTHNVPARDLLSFVKWANS